MREEPPRIRHRREIQAPDEAHDRDRRELLSVGSDCGRHRGLPRLGLHYELLPSGRGTSWPQSEQTEGEFVSVLEGEPDAWMDGVPHRRAPGGAVGRAAGTGIAPCFIDNTDPPVRRRVAGERDHNRGHDPLHARRDAAPGAFHGADAPARLTGDRAGLPSAPRVDPLEPPPA
jgi:uncharacterized cupin superfamily protein